MDEPPQPTSDGGEVYMGDTGEVEEKEKAQKTTADDELEIKSMKTAAIVISRGCQQVGSPFITAYLPVKKV